MKIERPKPVFTGAPAPSVGVLFLSRARSQAWFCMLVGGLGAAWLPDWRYAIAFFFVSWLLSWALGEVNAKALLSLGAPPQKTSEELSKLN